MKLTFAYYKEYMEEYLNKNISKKEFEDKLNMSLEVSSYINIIDKYAIIRKMSGYIDEKYFNDILAGTSNEDIYFLYMQYDIIKLFSILFEYTNILISITDMTFDNYDLIFKSGLYDYIYSRCHEDYDRFSESFDDSIGFKNTIILKQLSYFFSENENYGKFADAIEAFDKTIRSKKNKETINNIVKIMEFNNPRMAEIINESKEELNV